MEIDANMNWGSVGVVTPSKRSSAAPSAQGATETDSFSSSSALNGLQSAPDVRSEAVARGRALVAQDGYPPADTVKKLSGFLADKLSNGSAPLD